MTAASRRNGARRKNGFRHSMNNLFISGANGGEHPSQLRTGGLGVAVNKIVRAKSHAAFHRDYLTPVEIEPLRVDQGRLVVALKNIGRTVEVRDGLLDGSRPIG